MEFGLFMEFPAPDGYTDQQTFQQGFTLVDEAESMGVDSVWLAEYHFSPFSVLSAPLTVATALAARTKKIRLGFGVLLLPLNNPIRVAEEVATLDHISQGRLDFGIGRGTFPDHHDAFNSPFPESRGRFEEYLEIILKAWNTEQFSFEGEHYQCHELKVRPKPYQDPHPPIRVGITSAETFPSLDGWDSQSSSTPQGSSPFPNWLLVSNSTGRLGSKRVTLVRATWGCGCRFMQRRRPRTLTINRWKAPWLR